MFCPNCGKPLEEGAKFCSHCGSPAPQETPVSEAPEAPVSETPAAQANEAPAPEAPVNEAHETPAGEAPEASAAQPGEAPRTVTFTANETTISTVLRAVCGVLGAVFAFFALKNLFTTLVFLFQSVGSFPNVLRGYFPFGIAAYLFNFIVNLLLYLLMVAAPAVAAAALLLAAVKWEKKHADLVFCGVALAAVLRLALIVLAVPFTFLLRVFVYHGSLGLTLGFFSNSLLHLLGYMATAAVVFGLMYLLGTVPVMGESIDQIKANLRGSARDISGKVQKAASDVAARAAAAENPPAAPASAAAASSLNYSRVKKTNRSLLTYILLNLITCGIYSYIFIYGLANDVNEVCDGDGQKTGGLLAYLLLGFITCGIYDFIWWYKLCNRISVNGPRYGVTIQENGTTFLLWSLLGSLLCGIGPFIALHQVLRNMNTLCAAYNHANGLTA